MTHPIPAELETSLNRPVLDHLDGRSAHSDLGTALRAAVKPLGDVQLFSPHWEACRYVLAATKGVVFAHAQGMNTIGVRLDERMHARALVSGGQPCAKCGPGWVSFMLFRDDWPQVDLEFWVRKAYVPAREGQP